jgi:signal transduction histidine kinase
MISLNYQNILFILGTLVGIFLSVWVFAAGRKERINQLFSAMVLIWIVGEMTPYFIFRTFSLPREIISLLPKIEVAFVFIFFIFLYFFTLKFLGEEKKFLILDKIVLLVAPLGAILAIFTNSFQQEVIFAFDGKGLDLILTTQGKIFWLGFVFVMTFFIFFLFIFNYFKKSQKNKLKIQYFLIGITVWIIMNILFNVFFPLFNNTFKYSYLGNYSIIILFAFTAYAIVKQNLFGIRVVLTQILVSVIAILLFIQILGSKTTIEYIWKGVLFLTFIIFGYSLIRNVLREIKLREELEKAYVELKKLDTAKSEFISIASHQLRTPLAAMKGYLSMILDENYGPITARIKTKLQNVFLSNERLIRMVNDLLNVSRIESGRAELNIEETSVEDIIKGAVDILKLQAKDKKLHLIWEKPDKTLPKILVDADKTREIILNIIDNAIKYTQEGDVKVTAKAKQDSVLIKIADTGAGMSEEEIAKMFKSFSRGSAGNQFFTEGMGLGLYIARQFTDMQHGKIWAESDGKGKGSTFFLELPTK